MKRYCLGLKFFFLTRLSWKLKWAFLVVRFTFSSSVPEPLSQFQPKLAQNILGCRGIKFVQMKDHTLDQWEIITKWWKYIDEIFKKHLFQNHGASFKQNWHKASLGEENSSFVKWMVLEWKGIKFVQMKGHVLFQGVWWPISAYTCQIIMSTCQIFMLTCQLFILTCQIIIYRIVRKISPQLVAKYLIFISC